MPAGVAPGANVRASVSPSPARIAEPRVAAGHNGQGTGQDIIALNNKIEALEQHLARAVDLINNVAMRSMFNKSWSDMSYFNPDMSGWARHHGDVPPSLGVADNGAIPIPMKTVTINSDAGDDNRLADMHTSMLNHSRNVHAPAAGGGVRVGSKALDPKADSWPMPLNQVLQRQGEGVRPELAPSFNVRGTTVPVTNNNNINAVNFHSNTVIEPESRPGVNSGALRSTVGNRYQNTTDHANARDVINSYIEYLYTNKLKPIKVPEKAPRFDSKSDNPSDFLTRWERYVEVNGCRMFLMPLALLVAFTHEVDAAWAESWVAETLGFESHSDFASRGWRRMREAFLAHFNTPHIKEQHLAEWRALRAGDGPNAIREYITKFNIALAKCDTQPLSSVLFQFRKGLPSHLEYALGIHEGPEKIMTLDKLQDFAQNLEYVIGSTGGQQFFTPPGRNNNTNTNKSTMSRGDNNNKKQNKQSNTNNNKQKPRSHCELHGDCAHSTKECTTLQDRRAYGLKTPVQPFSAKCSICDDPNHNSRECPHNRNNKGKQTYAKAAAGNNNNNASQQRPFGTTSTRDNNSGNNNPTNNPRLKNVATKASDAAPQPAQK
jgi:hypothetical protein